MMTNTNISIIPQPLEINQFDGEFYIDENTELIYCSNDADIINSVSYFTNYLRNYYSINFNRCANRCCIEFKIENNRNAVIGEYSVEVSFEKIIIMGCNKEGLFYGMLTVLQLLPTTKQEQLNIQCVKIIDKPRFEYRGAHLDVVRHIFSVDYIKKYIDYLAMHKMNYFHIHLTDDQGWRIESKVHPALNEKGAYRRGTIVGLFPGTDVDYTPYGGYYTQDELKEIVEYAKNRHITIVPEIDIPGHSMAILATYPELGTNPSCLVKPAITWGIFNRQNNVLAPSEQTFNFLADVFNELMDIFPGEYIHIGADECAHKWWKESDTVQKYIQDNDLKDENGLQKYFAQRVSDIVTSRGRKVIGWDEMLQNGLIKDVIVMSWRNENGAYEAAKQGHKAILTPLSYSYLNMKQIVNERKLCHRMRTVSLKKVYSFDPIPSHLSASEASRILGGQACMWTEYFSNPAEIEYAIFPRLSAISEVYWSDNDVRNFKNFYKKLTKQVERYTQWDANYCYY